MKKMCFVVTAEFAVNAFLLNHLRFLSGEYEVTLLVNTSNPHFLKERGMDVAVIPLPISRAIDPFNDLRVLWKLIRLFSKNQFDVVHSLTPKAGFLSMLAAKWSGVPLRVHTFTGQVWANKKGIFRGVLKYVDKLTTSLATDLIVDSPSQLKFLLAEGVLEGNKAIVFGKGSIGGVDLKRFKPNLAARREVRVALGLPLSAFVFIFLGRVNRDKGIFDLLNAFEMLNRQDAYLLIVGPDEEGIVSGLARSSAVNLAKLRLVDYTSVPEDFLAASDVICLPSAREGFGSSIIEASAVGVPSIVSRIYGLTDAVEDGVTGLMHAPQDVAGILNAMQKLLDDRDLYESIRTAGRQRVARFFDADEMSKLWLDFYKRHFGFYWMVKKLKNNRVCILLCIFNGAKFLAEQLDSIAAQTHQNWMVVASDDGSSDATLDILRDYQKRWGPEKLDIRQGPKQGFAHNFLSLACDPKIKADYYAFCDQDDVWLPTKLAVAVTHISENAASNQPYVYSGRTHYVSETLKPLGYSPLFVFPRAFRNALVQSIAGGNTMVFNQSTKSILEKTGVFKVAAHDWWLYLLVEGVGGKVFYDPTPQILYRQHPGALIGSNNSTAARFERIVWLMLGRFKRWNSLHIAALTQVKAILTPENREIFEEFSRMRGSHILHRLRMIEVCGLYRQGWRGSLSLYLAAIFNKI